MNEMLSELNRLNATVDKIIELGFDGWMNDIPEADIMTVGYYEAPSVEDIEKNNIFQYRIALELQNITNSLGCIKFFSNWLGHQKSYLEQVRSENGNSFPNPEHERMYEAILRKERNEN